MNRIAVFFLLVITPLLAVFLALLGVETIPTNPLGWFLMLVGIVYAAGMIIAYTFKQNRFWEVVGNRDALDEERGDRSFWFITLGMVVVLFVSPLEFLFVPAFLPRNHGLSSSGVGLVVIGVILFTWARVVLKREYSGHLKVRSGHQLVQAGPYAVIRHPAYAGYLFMSLGVSLGYSSIVGLVSILVILLPSLVYRIHVEEKLLGDYFGEEYYQYAKTVKRLIPWVW